MLILFNKPFQVLSQFSPLDKKETLRNYIPFPSVYPAGRLDYDSEGLLLLTDDGALQHTLANPRFKVWKTYFAQVEGVPNEAALHTLSTGVMLNDGLTRPAKCQCCEPLPFSLWERTPPIRYRASIPTCWIRLMICEGRNRQVRRMTAAVGHPTLRLIRYAVGDHTLGTLTPGEYRLTDSR